MGHNPNPGIIFELISGGASADAVTSVGVTVLMIAAACSNPRPDVIAALIVASACTKNPAIVSALLFAGADVNAKDDNGWAALTYAGSNGQSNEVIEMLLAAGAKD